jgi:hypothetical protein
VLFGRRGLRQPHRDRQDSVAVADVEVAFVRSWRKRDRADERPVREFRSLGLDGLDSSEWRLGLDLEPAMIDRVLDLLTRSGPEFSEIVTAATDPESPAGIARRSALERESRADRDDKRGAALVSATEPSNLGGADLQASRSVGEEAAWLARTGHAAYRVGPRLIRVDLDELEAMMHHVGESSWA